MPRPKSYFERNEFAKARRTARDRGLKLFLFQRTNREGKKMSGYYVGNNTPARWKSATFETKKV